MGGSDQQVLSWRQRAAAAPVTAALVGICASAFAGTLAVCASTGPDPGAIIVQSAWSLGACRETLVGAGALDLARVWVDGEWWRVASTGLLHGSLIHLALNMWSLVSIGEWSERLWGPWRTAVLFAVSSLAGCLASLAWAEAPMVVGASAGILGIAGALLVARSVGTARVRQELDPISARALGLCLALLVAIGFFVPLIAQAGHLGGLAGGFALGIAWGRDWRVHPAVPVAAVLFGCLGLGLAGQAPVARPGYEEFVGYRYLERGEHSRAAEALERVLVARPDDVALKNAIAYALAEANTGLDRAKELADAAVSAEPDNADFLDTLGWIECRRGNREAGLAALERAENAATGTIPEIAQHQRMCGL